MRTSCLSSFVLVFILYSVPGLASRWARAGLTKSLHSLFHTHQARDPGGSGKRGLIYDNATLTTFFGDSTSIPWAHNNEAVPNGLNLSRYEFVPVLHNSNSDALEAWAGDVSAALNTGSKYLIGFNLPDTLVSLGGTQIDPVRAATLYLQHMQPYSGKAELGAPTPYLDNSGMSWLSSFVAACGGCTIDFLTVELAFRSDNSSAVLADMKTWVDHFRTTFGKPIWITAITLIPGIKQSKVLEILDATLPWLDAQEFVHRYAWSCDADYLTTSNGLTAAGRLYRTSNNMAGKGSDGGSNASIPDTTPTSSLPSTTSTLAMPLSTTSSPSSPSGSYIAKSHATRSVPWASWSKILVLLYGTGFYIMMQ